MTKKLAIQISIGVLITIVILVVMAALIGKHQVGNAPGNVIPPGKTRACTEEAKLCPDGTSVGRTGPNCEFTPCPKNDKSISSRENKCTSNEEVQNLWNQIDAHNQQIASETKYSNTQYGLVSIDFGKYGYKVIDDRTVGFGPWIITEGPCVFEITQKYILSFKDPVTKEKIIDEVKKQEFGDKIDYLKFREIRKINSLDVIIWEEQGGYPTYQLFFEIPGKIKNYHIETDMLQSDETDYRRVIDIIKTMKLQK